MTDLSPNPEQQELIDSHDGIYKVDAGAGTGKTFTVTLRYAEILEEKDVRPQDLLLLTFTNNAADEMKERIINECSYETRELRDAPISTFHSLAKKIINENGFEIPNMIGINDSIATSTRLIENEVLEKQEFRSFINNFISENPEYHDKFRALNDYSDLLGLIKGLAAKGVIPQKEGWYKNSEKHLDGDEHEFYRLIEEKNNSDENMSQLNSNLYGVFNKCLDEDAPSETEVRKSGNNVDDVYVQDAFEDDRGQLKDFIHDIYFEYIQYCLSRNYLNFNFLLVFAYILLCEDEIVREELQFEYTMIDEFQDTNEIQLKIAMLLSKGNIAAVGDWKQSIYSFQYAEVENIQNFSKRLKEYKKELNEDRERIDYSVQEINRIDLKQNYRSTQEILDFSEKSLVLPGKKHEDVDESILEKVTSLESNREEEYTIQALQSDEEEKAVLSKIQQVVDNEEYLSDSEKLDYGDIAVLTRNSKFGLELQKKAGEYGIPIAYEGGIKLFTKEPSILLLAWLRVLDYRDSKKGWAVILENAGYNIEEIKKITDEKDYPQNLLEFRKELDSEDYISGVSTKVFRRYGIQNSFSDKITEILQNTFDNSYKSTGDLIQFIEESIEEGATYQVDSSTKQESVTVQTIHSAKGLEYPAVFIADINQSRFPSTNSNKSCMIYSDLIGLRQKRYYNPKRQYLFDSWKTYLVQEVEDDGYDEERRLMYVAMTRAKNHLFLSATEDRPSKFFENLDIENEILEPELEKVEFEEEKLPELELENPDKKASIKRSVHSVMDLDETTEGRGPEFGVKVHRFAEKYARGEDVQPENEDEENVKEFIDSLEGEVRPEVPIKVPVEEEGRKILYSGVIDLLHITEEKIEIIDWKTDLTKENEEEYQKQLEIYKNGVNKTFEEIKVESKIFYTQER
jgi:superfamily I DNA/RNA helicase